MLRKPSQKLPLSAAPFVLLALDLVATSFVVVMTVLCLVALFYGGGNAVGKGLAGALWACSIAAVWLFHLVLQDARFHDPFTRRNVSRLNWMGALVLLPWLLTSDWLSRVAQWFGDRQEFSLPNPGELSVGGLVLALVLFGLAGVFQQGVRLREEQELTV